MKWKVTRNRGRCWDARYGTSWSGWRTFDTWAEAFTYAFNCASGNAALNKFYADN